jgi:hypothetical protein
MTSAPPCVSAYAAAPDLWVVTAYFNPAGYETRRRNYRRFIQPFADGGVPHLLVQCAFGDASFDALGDEHSLRIRARDVLWQKERLLNLAIAALPPSCTKVAWVDADVLFTNPNWALETSQLLDRFVLVQPYGDKIHLPPGTATAAGTEERIPGMVRRCGGDPIMAAGPYELHGGTGAAWAAQRQLVDRCGLYDACIIGGGDHAIAHASYGDWESKCVAALIGLDTPAHRHFRDWAQNWHAQVRGSIAYTPGTVLHLWHGERANRRYSLRHKEQKRYGFDPTTDLRRGETGCWEWASDKPEMHAWAARYFVERREDAAGIDAYTAPVQSRYRPETPSAPVILSE